MSHMDPPNEPVPLDEPYEDWFEEDEEDEDFNDEWE